jgi:hypothetical protein
MNTISNKPVTTNKIKIVEKLFGPDISTLKSMTTFHKSLPAFIYLRYNDNSQGVHELLHLPTNSLITRYTVTPLPLTPLAIINQVHTLAEQEKMPDGPKISNRTGQLFMIVVWNAGVDYDNETFKDAQDEDYNQQQASDDNSNEKLLKRDYDEMAPDEIYEAPEQFELDNIQEDDPEPDGNNENNVEMNADEIKDEDEEPVNETENEEAMIE